MANELLDRIKFALKTDATGEFLWAANKTPDLSGTAVDLKTDQAAMVRLLKVNNHADPKNITRIFKDTNKREDINAEMKKDLVAYLINEKARSPALNNLIRLGDGFGAGTNKEWNKIFDIKNPKEKAEKTEELFKVERNKLLETATGLTEEGIKAARVLVDDKALGLKPAQKGEIVAAMDDTLAKDINKAKNADELKKAIKPIADKIKEKDARNGVQNTLGFPVTLQDSVKSDVLLAAAEVGKRADWLATATSDNEKPKTGNMARPASDMGVV